MKNRISSIREVDGVDHGYKCEALGLVHAPHRLAELHVFPSSPFKCSDTPYLSPILGLFLFVLFVLGAMPI